MNNSLKSTTLITFISIFSVTAAVDAQVIGSWQNTSGDGWIDWGNGLSITDPSNTSIYSFVSGAVPGYSQSLQVAESGWHQDLSIKLENTGQNAAFLNNHLLTFTLSVNGTGYTAGYDQINGFDINASGLGFHGMPGSTFTATGDQASNGNLPNFYFWSGIGFQSQTVTIDYSSILPLVTATPSSGYIELIFTTNNGGGAPNYLDFNNVVLSGGPVPEPSTLALAGLGAISMFVFFQRRKHIA